MQVHNLLFEGGGERESVCWDSWGSGAYMKLYDGERVRKCLQTAHDLMSSFSHFPPAVSVEHMECEIKLEAPATPEREAAADADTGKGLLEDSEEVKKRKRKPYRPGEESLPGSCLRNEAVSSFLTHLSSVLGTGIGGFMVRQRKSHTRLKKGSAALSEASREVTGAEGHPEEGKC